ncbi:uncharacterized protein [Rutidosis leptorrhynchoides]|uniref:uncharacterized protein n=1 Tax=Rutidosis leptorrhynchoides TaxID=125765 RepID=UPI003A99FDCC
MYSDHKNLKYFFDQRDLNNRQRRWLDLLKDYDLEILYHSGKANVVADVLCRMNQLPSLQVKSLRTILSNDFLEKLGQVWVLKLGGHRAVLLNEAYKSKYSIHLGGTKMYLDLKKEYWWPVMKRDVVNCVEQCVTCLQVKVEHRKPYGMVGQNEVGGIEVVLETNQKIDVICARLKAAQDRQKSYADKHRRPIEFNEGDMVMLKVSPRKGVIWFRKRGKLAPRFIGPFKVLARCLADDSMWVPLNEITLNNKLEYVEEPFAILDEKVKEIQNKRIRNYKVQWRHQKGSECTWESEDFVMEFLPSLHAAWIAGT